MRRAPPAVRWMQWRSPVCQCRLGLRGCRSARRALPGWSRALRPRSQPARSSRPAGTFSAGHAAAWLNTAHWVGASPNVHRVGDRRVLCAAAEGHRLKVRCGHGSATASGRIGQCPHGQPVTAWPSVGARRMQQIEIGADSCAARARPCRDHAPQESRRTRGHPSAWSAALPSWSLGRFRRNWIRRFELRVLGPRTYQTVPRRPTRSTYLPTPQGL